MDCDLSWKLSHALGENAYSLIREDTVYVPGSTWFIVLSPLFPYFPSDLIVLSVIESGVFKAPNTILALFLQYSQCLRLIFMCCYYMYTCL